MIKFKYEDGVLKGIFISPTGEERPWTGHKYCEYMGEGVTVEMYEAFLYGQEIGRKSALNRITKELKKIIES